jgi:hypothetical protein
VTKDKERLWMTLRTTILQAKAKVKRTGQNRIPAMGTCGFQMKLLRLWPD